jgi:hypothetical protein
MEIAFHTIICRRIVFHDGTILFEQPVNFVSELLAFRNPGRPLEVAPGPSPQERVRSGCQSEKNDRLPGNNPGGLQLRSGSYLFEAWAAASGEGLSTYSLFSKDTSHSNHKLLKSVTSLREHGALQDLIAISAGRKEAVNGSKKLCCVAGRYNEGVATSVIFTSNARASESRSTIRTPL